MSSWAPPLPEDFRLEERPLARTRKVRVRPLQVVSASQGCSDQVMLWRCGACDESISFDIEGFDEKRQRKAQAKLAKFKHRHFCFAHPDEKATSCRTFVGNAPHRNTLKLVLMVRGGARVVELVIFGVTLDLAASAVSRS